MDKLFLTILNMSLTGAFVIAAICLARLPLKKAPKIISYCLWVVAGFRLIIPYSIESIFSLIPYNAQPIPPDIAMQPIPRIESGIPFLNNAVGSVLPAAEPAASVNPLQIWTFIGSWVWVIGVAAMLVYGVVSYIILKRKMRNYPCVEENIYEAENIKSPFVLGLVNPNIYLPLGLSEQERRYIILHERTHINRHDHLIKFSAYFILCLHWFNPLAWAAFFLMSADMEMSCDERVLKEMGGEIKKDYSLSLLSMATERRIINSSPLAFGENDVKERLKNVLNFKKPSRIIMVVSFALVVVLSIGFAVNRITEANMMDNENSGIFIDDDKLIQFSSLRTPYVGNNSAVGNIVNELPPIDINYTQKFFSIGDDYGTNRAPYTLTVYYERSNEGAGYEIKITNALLLFALIDNLEEVTLALRETPSDDILDKSAYTGFITYSRDEFTEYINAMGLSWDDFQNDWENTIGIMYAQSLTGNMSAPSDIATNLTLDEVRALAAKGGDLRYSDLPNLRPSMLSSMMGGYNPTLYNVEGGYRLLIHFNDTLNPESGINSTSLESIWESGGSGIDIRYNNVDEFIRTSPSHPAVVIAEAKNIAQAYSGKPVTPIDLEWWELSDEFPHHSKDPAKQAMWEALDTIGQTCEVFIDEDGAFIAIGRRNGAIYTYDNGIWFARTGVNEWNDATQNMTLNDVRAIAQKIGTDLTMGDFRDFIGEDIGSGIFVMQFLIENSDYVMLVGSGSIYPASPVVYALLIYMVDGGENDSIDIRYYDVDKFIENGTKALIRPLPEEPDPQTTTPSTSSITPQEAGINVLSLDEWERNFGITMNITSFNAGGLSFYFEHQSNIDPVGIEFIYGSGYVLYKKRGNEWEQVKPIIDNAGFTDEGYNITPQSRTETITVDWRWLYGELPDGEYKFEKYVNLWRSPGDYDKYLLQQDFTLP